MKEGTKDRIIKLGAEIIHLKGFNNTGLQEILKAAQIPKGSFYNYFSSKEDFGLQVIDYFNKGFTLNADKFLKDTSLTPLKRLRKYFYGSMDFFKSNDYKYGCPIGNLMQEMGDLNPTFRRKLKIAIETMVQCYSQVLSEAQNTGELPETLDVRETAYFILSSYQGALLSMKVEKSLKPLERHCEFIFDTVLKAGSLK